jgi:hypothetical protein
MSLWNKNINHEQNFIFYHYYNSWFFQLGFLVKKNPKVTGIKKTTLSIWINHFGHVLCDWAIELDLVIVIGKVTDKMINYSTRK